MLTSFIKEGHDHTDTMCFSCGSGNDPFKILEMIIRGHVILMAAYAVGKAEIGNIYHNKKVCTADRFFDDSFAFASTEAGTFTVYKKSIFAVTLWYNT